MDALSITYITLETIIGVLSTVGNAMVLIAINRSHALQTITNCFIASLALADMLVGIIVAPLAALSFVGLPHNFLGCVFINSVVILFTQVSIFSLLAVAVERFLAIVIPFFYQKHMTSHRAILLLVVIWIAGIIVGLVPMFGWNLGPPEDMVCAFTRVIDMSYMVYFNFLGFVLVPLVIMFCIYLYIYAIVRQQMIKIAALEIAVDGRKKKRKFMKEIKAAKSLAIVLGLFTICWLPIHLANTVNHLCGSGCGVPYPFIVAAILISHANSVFNPFLYAYGNTRFMSEFKKMLCLFKESDSFTTEDRSVSNIVNTTRSDENPQQERF
ncbi:adenosine receptor A2b-like [Gigantopelta aegis]|uniref:adenosine receptor A2b-like n=1 Tax=Gigantopelta aegis TaxID=1735272 RepID=UPI001B88BA94|nr:adenosine receptor A2b-like [Gigantopelta aegis]